MKGQERKELLRVEEVGRQLCLSKQAVYSLAASGELPSIKFGRAVRFDQADVEAYIRIHRRGEIPPAA